MYGLTPFTDMNICVVYNLSPHDLSPHDGKKNFEKTDLL